MLAALDGPIIQANTVTPSDSVLFAQVSRGIYIGGAGNINIGWGVPQSGVYPANTTFVGVVAGTILPVRANQIYATGTTATNLLVLY